MKFKSFEHPLNALLTPPIGYALGDTLLTTYTMSKRILADILLEFGAADEGLCLSDSGPIQLRLKLEQYAAKSLGRVKILVGEVGECLSTHALAGLDEYLTGLMPQFLQQIPMKTSSFFHPKIILIRFTSKTSNYYRLSISSKNLTYDHFFQAGLVLEGEVGSESNTNGSALLEFLQQLDGAEAAGWGELSKVNFTYNGAAVSLHFGTPQQGLLDAIRADFCAATDCLFVSDSINADLPKILNLPAEQVTMLSNSKSWAGEFWDWANNRPKCEIPQYCKVIDGPFPYIHAKIFGCHSGDRSIIWLGSANCTSNALSNNYEAMVRLEYAEKLDFSRLTKHINGSRGFRTVTWDDLESGKSEGEIERYIQGLSLVARYQENRLRIEITDPAAACPEQLDSLYLALGSIALKKKIVFNEAGNSENLDFICGYWQLPHSGKANIMAILKDKQRHIVEVNMEFDSTLNQKFAEGSTEELGQNLYKNILPKVQDVIPPCNSKGFYSASDTGDIRIAKYFAYRRSIDLPADFALIMENINTTFKKCSDISEDEEDEGIDVITFNSTLKAYRRELLRLKNYLEEWEK